MRWGAARGAHTERETERERERERESRIERMEWRGLGVSSEGLFVVGP